MRTCFFGGAISAAVVALAVLFWPEASPTRPVAASAAAVTSAEESKTHRTWEPGDSRTVPTDVPKNGQGVHLIDEVLVDRMAPCVNEPVLVEVKGTPGRVVQVHVDTNVGNPVPVTFPFPGKVDVLVRVVAEDGVEDFRTFAMDVHDCGGAFQYVQVQHEGTEKWDTQRFVAAPFFDRAECAGLAGPDGGRASRADVMRCNGRPASGETLTYTWDFGDGAKQTTREGYVEHDYANRTQSDPQSTFLVKVEVASSVLGNVAGLTSVVFDNTYYRNKRLGLVAPRIDLTTRTGSKVITWEATVYNPDSAKLTLRDVVITETPCEAGGELKSFRRPAQQVMEATDFPRGTTSTQVHLAADDVGAGYCSVSFRATGTAPGDLKVSAIFGAQLRDDIGAKEMRADDADPRTRKRYERTVRALQILGRDPAAGPATVSDDEIRALQLQGKLD